MLHRLRFDLKKYKARLNEDSRKYIMHMGLFILYLLVTATTGYPMHAVKSIGKTHLGLQVKKAFCDATMILMIITNLHMSTRFM